MAHHSPALDRLVLQQQLAGGRSPMYTQITPPDPTTYSRRLLAPTEVLLLGPDKLGFVRALALPPTNAAGQFAPEHVAGWPRCGVVVLARLFTRGDSASCAAPLPVALKILDRQALADCRDSLEEEVAVMRLLQPEGFDEARPVAPFLLRWLAICPQSRLGGRLPLPPPCASSFLVMDQGGPQLCTWFFTLVRRLHASAGAGGGVLDTANFLSRFVYPTLLRVLQGVAYLHGRGVCHLDLDPANVVVVPNAGFDVAPMLKFIDFGSGCRVSARGGQVPLAHLHRVKCKIPWRAPEIDHSRALLGCSCDLWSVGVMLYWMVMPVLRAHAALNFNLAADHVDDKDMQIFNVSVHVLAARQRRPHPPDQIKPTVPCGLCFLESELARTGQQPLPVALLNQFYYLLQPHPRKRVAADEVARRLVRAGVPRLPDGWPSSPPPPSPK
jgi:serine/threonine protein kinase